jgi:hypothetical protein
MVGPSPFVGRGGAKLIGKRALELKMSAESNDTNGNWQTIPET